MKKHFFYLPFLLLVVFSSCKKDEIMLYEGETYIQFSKSYNDSSLFSFLALPNDDQAQVPVVLELIGKPEKVDRTYKLSVIKDLTNAPEANYSFPETFTLKANRTIDTAWITVKKTPGIAVAPVKLVYKIDQTSDFKVGQTEYAVSILYISNIIARPDWWNGTVEGRFLGAYSDKKYTLFIEVTGRSDINSANTEELRYYTILFKNYLLREKDAGRTVYEASGTEMTTALLGG